MSESGVSFAPGPRYEISCARALFLRLFFMILPVSLRGRGSLGAV